MTESWAWALSSERGRDNLLREEIEQLHESEFRARRTTSQLSSQLSQLQGTLENRLNALSAAFDAYVELGDIRAELDRYPDTALIRNQAARTLQMLELGREASPLDDRGPDYWLVPAVNSVIALARGDRDGAAEQEAVSLDPDARWFIVAAAGVIGRGVAVGDEVPALLTCDSEVSPRQQVLWWAVVAGCYGDVLQQVGAVWAPLISTDVVSWRNWLSALAQSPAESDLQRGLEALRALAELVAPTVRAPDQSTPAPQPSPRSTISALDDLRALVSELAARGIGEESQLLARAKVLRATIENPTAARPDPTSPAIADAVELTDLVRTSLLHAAAPGSALRAELLRWVSPQLLGATHRLRQEILDSDPITVPVLSEGRRIDVSDRGAPADAVSGAEQAIDKGYRYPAQRLALPAVVTAVLVCFGLALGAASQQTGAVLVLLVAGVGVVVTLLAALARRQLDGRRADALTRLHRELDEAQETAQHRRSLQQQSEQEAAGLVEQLQCRLGA